MPTNSDILRFGELLAYKNENENLSNNVAAWESCSHAWKRKLKLIKEEKDNLQSENEILKSKISEQSESFKQLKLEMNQLKSANDLTLNELAFKKTVYFAKEKRFMKIINELQSYNSYLEDQLSSNTASTPETNKTNMSSTPSKSSISSSTQTDQISLDSILDDSILDKFEKVEKRFESLKSKSIDTYLNAHPQLNPLHERKPVSVPDDISKKFFQSSETKTKTKFNPTSLYSKKVPKPTKVSVNPNLKASTPTKSSVKSSSPVPQRSTSYFSKSENSTRFKVTETVNKETKTRYHDQYGWFVHNKKPQVSGSTNKQVWRPKVNLSKKPTKSFKYSFSKLFELAPRNRRVDVQKMNDFVQQSPTVFKSPLIPRTLFQEKTQCVKSQWNSTSLNHIDTTYKWFEKVSKTIGPVLRWVPKVVLK